jgi:type VI protein secretion system component Hcp
VVLCTQSSVKEYSVIDIDLDVDVETFKELKDWFMKRIEICSRGLNIVVKGAICTDSYSDKVHCYIHLEKPIDTETFLLMSFCSGDDVKRLQLTLERLCIYKDMLRYMFTYKFIRNEIKNHYKNKNPNIEQESKR